MGQRYGAGGPRSDHYGEYSIPSVNETLMPSSYSSSSVRQGGWGSDGPTPGLSNQSTLISTFGSAHTAPYEQGFDDSSEIDRRLSPARSIPSVISSLSGNGEPSSFIDISLR